jgi:hypothetical protein
MRRGWVWLAGVAGTAAAMLGGCGAEVPSRAELVESLERSGLPTAKAECAADAVLGELTDDEIIRIVERGPAGAPRDDPDVDGDSADRVRAALAECQQVGAEETITTTEASQGAVGAPEGDSSSSTSDPG